jgi:hypothetical protein
LRNDFTAIDLPLSLARTVSMIASGTADESDSDDLVLLPMV